MPQGTIYMDSYWPYTFEVGRIGIFTEVENDMKTARAIVMGLGVMLAPGLFAAPACAVNCPVPEPSAIPELVLCLAVTGISFLIWSRSRKSA